jgi:hypothetical protein
MMNKDFGQVNKTDIKAANGDFFIMTMAKIHT